ncbi:MAG: rhamnulose-1-phosphate aldolase [Bacilli bacterium]|nr:rhamnulose-1-phosphate aldolase [Bacilli bacterium]
MTDKVLSCPTVVEVIRATTNMYRQGWDERNGGNISVILTDEEVKEYIPTKAIRPINVGGVEVKNLAGKYIVVTGTGKYFKNVEVDPAVNLGIIRVTEDGKGAELVWGLVDGKNPTSELPTHLENHSVRLAIDPAHRVVIHCHATHTLALSFVLPEDEDEITKVLWKMQTESIVVFPEGVGYVPWMVCGGKEIGDATCEKMKQYRCVIWGMHGVFGVGHDVDEAFGLIETVEKAAIIYFLVKDNMKQCITDDQLKEVAAAFKLNYKKII